MEEKEQRLYFVTEDGDRWGFEEFLGAGTDGKVFRARKEDGSDFCAVKCFENGPKDEREKQRDSEYRHLKGVHGLRYKGRKHAPETRGLGYVLEPCFGKSILQPALAMDVVEGVPLTKMQEFLGRNGILSAGDALAVARALVEVVAALDDAGVAHRDLHPDNLLADCMVAGGKLMGIRSIYCVGFGLAQKPGFWTPPPPEGARPGAYGFNAPETYGGPFCEGGQATPSANVWSFGAILCYLATGTAPFEEEAHRMNVDHLWIGRDYGKDPDGCTAALKERLGEFAEEKSGLFCVPDGMLPEHGDAGILRALINLTVVADPAKRLTARQVEWLLAQDPDESNDFGCIVGRACSKDLRKRELARAMIVEGCRDEAPST